MTHPRFVINCTYVPCTAIQNLTMKVNFLFAILALQHIVVVFSQPDRGFSFLVFEDSWTHTTTHHIL